MLASIETLNTNISEEIETYETFKTNFTTYYTNVNTLDEYTANYYANESNVINDNLKNEDFLLASIEVDENSALVEDIYNIMREAGDWIQDIGNDIEDWWEMKWW